MEKLAGTIVEGLLSEGIEGDRFVATVGEKVFPAWVQATFSGQAEWALDEQGNPVVVLPPALDD